MLLRVPAASLTDFGNYGDGMDARGYKYWTIGTKMSFDTGESYPKIIFEPIRRLEDDEAVAVLELRKSQAVQNILAEGSDLAQEAVIEATIKLPAGFHGEDDPKPVTPKVTTPAPPPPAKEAKEPKEPKTKLPAQPSPIDGFGGESAKPSTSTKTPKQKAAVSPPPPSSDQPPEEGEAAADDSFEASLDAQIENLLPEN
jgi:hypothetical protein